MTCLTSLGPQNASKRLQKEEVLPPNSWILLATSPASSRENPRLAAKRAAHEPASDNLGKAIVRLRELPVSPRFKLLHVEDVTRKWACRSHLTSYVFNEYPSQIATSGADVSALGTQKLFSSR